MQAALARGFPQAAKRHPLARHVPAGADARRPGRVRAVLHGLGAGGIPTGGGRTAAAGDRRQDRPRLVRPQKGPLAPAPGERLRYRGRPRAGATGGRGEGRRADRPSRPARRPRPPRLPGEPGRARLPAGDRRVDRGGAYLLALKGNRKKAHAEVRDWFAANAFALGGSLRPVLDAFDDGHGRLVRRRVFACPDAGAFTTLKDWPGLRAVLAVETIRGTPGRGKVTAEIRHYLSSTELPPAALAAAIRNHWRIENGLHWVLDVTFREDASRVRDRNAARNLGLLRRIALNLARADATLKASPKGKRKYAAWDNDFMATLIAG